MLCQQFCTTNNFIVQSKIFLLQAWRNLYRELIASDNNFAVYYFYSYFSNSKVIVCFLEKNLNCTVNDTAVHFIFQKSDS